MSEPEFTVESARDASESGHLAEWVEAFLASDGSDNAELGRQLCTEYAEWSGPIRLPFDELHRLAGPPDQPTLERLQHDDLETVDDMMDSVEAGWTPPPFVVTWQEDHLVLEDGNHRIEGLRRSGEDTYWCVIGFRDTRAKRQFARESPA